MCLLQPPGYPKRDKWEPLLYRVDVQADLSFCWLHRTYRFCHSLAHFSKKIWLDICESSARQKIHKKCKALFSLENKKKKLRMCAVALIGALRLNILC